MMSGLALIILVCHSIIWLVASTCEITSKKQLMALANGNYPLCRDVNLTATFPICERDESDESGRPSPDGTWNRTCYLEMTTDFQQHLTCVCKTFASDDVFAASWTGWEALSPPVGGAYFGRQLMAEGECIARELNLMWRYVVAGYDLPNSVFYASCIQSASYPAYKARVDAYWEEIACAYVAPVATDPYLKITLPTPYKINGVFFLRRCDLASYATVISVTTSLLDAEESWDDVVIGEDLSAQFAFAESAFVSFPQIYTTWYWEIILHDSTYSYPRVKLDLLTVPI